MPQVDYFRSCVTDIGDFKRLEKLAHVLQRVRHLRVFSLGYKLRYACQCQFSNFNKETLELCCRACATCASSCSLGFKCGKPASRSMQGASLWGVRMPVRMPAWCLQAAPSANVFLA